MKHSGKLVLLDKLLPRLKQQGHRVLLFSQFKVGQWDVCMRARMQVYTKKLPFPSSIFPSWLCPRHYMADRAPEACCFVPLSRNGAWSKAQEWFHRLFIHDDSLFGYVVDTD